MDTDRLNQRRIADRACDDVEYAGPAVYPTTPASTGPASPTAVPLPERIRWNHRSFYGDTAIPSEHALGLKHFRDRAGGPRLARLPIDDDLIPGDTGVILSSHSVRCAITLILEKHEIAVIELTHLRRKWFGAPEKFSSVHDTVVVIVKHSDGKNVKWLHACTEIRRVCVENNVAHVNVEIAHLDSLKLNRSFLVENTHGLAQNWFALRPAIVGILGERDWLAVDVLRFGVRPVAVDNPVSIIITVHEESTTNWSVTTDSITGLLDANGYLDVAVRIGRGSICRGVTAQEEKPELPEDSWERQVKMGRSIGVGGPHPTAGTLGGFLVLEFANGTHMTYGVTCYHVVCPQRRPEGSMGPESSTFQSMEDRRQVRDRLGMPLSDTPTEISVEYPARVDHEHAVKMYKQNIVDAHTPQHIWMTDTIGTSDAGEMGRVFGANAQRRQEYIDREQRMVDKMEAWEQGVSSVLGQVVAGSGYRRANRVADWSPTLDWALIKLASGRTGINNLPEMKEFPRENQGKYAMDSEMKEMAQLGDDRTDQIDCCKGGRIRLRQSTWSREMGFSIAAHNNSGTAKSTIQSWGFDGDGKYWHSFDSDRMLAGVQIPEDSGAFVLSAKGRLMGLIWAGNTYSKVAYFTGIDDLVEDIKHITGAINVRLP